MKKELHLVLRGEFDWNAKTETAQLTPFGKWQLERSSKAILDNLQSKGPIKIYHGIPIEQRESAKFLEACLFPLETKIEQREEIRSFEDS